MSGEGNDQETILLKVEDTPPCPQCDGSTPLLARFPHSWKNRLGRDVTGLGETVLCPGCHHGDPATTELLASYAVDDEVPCRPSRARCAATVKPRHRPRGFQDTPARP